MSPCPECGTPIVAERAATPWCPECEWNLDAPEPRWWQADSVAPRIRSRLERRTRRSHAQSYRMVRDQYRALLDADAPLSRSGVSRDRAGMLAVSVLLLAIPVGCVLLAVWTFNRMPFLPALLVAGLLLGLAVLMRPRFPTLDDGSVVLRRSDAPELYALVDEVAAATGARPVHLLTVSHEYNAGAGAVGVLRRRQIELGLPLWAVLPPQQRVALLGHEVGHFVNRDVRHGLLVQPALTMLARLALVLRPFNPGRRAKLSDMAASALSWVVLWPVSRLLLRCQAALWRWGFRDGQRAEYLADEMAAAVAGTDATAGMLDRLLLGPDATLVVRRQARQGEDATGWRAAVDEVMAATPADRLRRLRQLSVRWESGRYASHPPKGMRADMLEARSPQPPTVVLDPKRSDRIDDELAEHYRRFRRVVAKMI